MLLKSQQFFSTPPVCGQKKTTSSRISSAYHPSYFLKSSEYFPAIFPHVTGKSRRKKRKKYCEPTLWKSEFMYPFYVSGCESNLLLQFDSKEGKRDEKNSTINLTLCSSFSRNFHKMYLFEALYTVDKKKREKTQI